MAFPFLRVLRSLEKSVRDFCTVSGTSPGCESLQDEAGYKENYRLFSRLSQTVIIPLSQLPFSLLGQNKPFLAAGSTTAQPTPCPPTTCLIILKKDPSFHHRYYSSGELMLTFVIDMCYGSLPPFYFLGAKPIIWKNHLSPTGHIHNGICLNSGHLFSCQWPSKLTHARIVGVILFSGEKTKLVGLVRQDHVVISASEAFWR